MKISFKIDQKIILIFLLFASIFALAGAYISQYFFGLQPCVLCLYQRIPFFLTIAVILAVLPFDNLKKYRNFSIKLSLIFLVINVLLALYHVGVEHKIFIFDGCADLSANITNLEDLKRQLLSAKAVRCDEPQFVLFGISMAGYNAIYCSFIVFLSIPALRQSFTKK